MRRLMSFVAVASLAAAGCKATVGPISTAGFLNIYVALDAGPATNMDVDFGSSCPGFAVTRVLTIQNDSMASVNITGVSLSNTSAFSLVPPVIPANTEVGMNVTQTISFDPTGQGPVPSATFTVATSNGGPPTDAGGPASYSVTLSGTGVSAPTDPTFACNCPGSPGQTTSCNAIDFPTTYVGQTSNITVNVEDQGCTPMSLMAVIVCGDAGAMPFSVLPPIPSTVAFGNPVGLVVQYAPLTYTHADLDNCSLVLTTNDTSNPTVVIPLVGTNSNASVTITDPFPCPPPGLGGYLIDAGMKPGQVNVGETVIFPVTITNQGALPLVIGTPYFADAGPGYVVVDGGWSGTLYSISSGMTPTSATFDVAFTSPAAGSFVDTLVIPVTDGQPTQCVMQANSGGQLCTVPPGQIPQVTLPATNLLCTYTDSCITLQNCGSAPINIFAANVNDGGQPSFMRVDAGGGGVAVLQPGDDYPVCVSMTDPGTLGFADGGQPYDQNIVLSTDAPGYDAGYLISASATTYFVPQPANLVPVPISGLDDAGNPKVGQEITLLADIDAGMGQYYDFTWATPDISILGESNVCADGGGPAGSMGVSLSYSDGGEFYVTPVEDWNNGVNYHGICKVCVFLQEKDSTNPPPGPTGNCNFSGGTSPTVFHCWGCTGSVCTIVDP